MKACEMYGLVTRYLSEAQKNSFAREIVRTIAAKHPSDFSHCLDQIPLDVIEDEDWVPVLSSPLKPVAKLEAILKIPIVWDQSEARRLILEPSY